MDKYLDSNFICAELNHADKSLNYFMDATSTLLEFNFETGTKNMYKYYCGSFFSDSYSLDFCFLSETDIKDLYQEILVLNNCGVLIY